MGGRQAGKGHRQAMHSTEMSGQPRPAPYQGRYATEGSMKTGKSQGQ